MEKKKLQVEKIIEWALEKKAEEVKFYDIHEESDFTDFVVVCEGSGRTGCVRPPSARQHRARSAESYRSPDERLW